MVNSFGIDVLESKHKPLGEHGKRLTLDGPSLLVAANIEAPSPYSALEAFADRVRVAIDVVNFYHHKTHLTLSGYGYAGSETDEYSVSSGSGAVRLKPHRDAMDLATGTLRTLASSARLPESLSRSLEHHSLAFSAVDARVRFINLWTALEALSTGSSGGVIDRVIAMTTPIVVARWPQKILKYLAIGIRRSGILGEGSFLRRAAFQRSRVGYVHPSDILQALAIKPDASPLAPVVESLSDEYALLRYRIHRFCKMFSSPKAFGKRMRDSKTRLAWQIRRIYRARNMLTHGSERPRSLAYLTDNLHFYYCSVVSHILEALRQNPEWSVPIALYHARARLSFIQTCLRDHPDKVRENDLLSMGTEACIWPAPPCAQRHAPSRSTRSDSRGTVGSERDE